MKIGILGGGQLAQMMALAATPLGIEIIAFDPNNDPCANKVCRVIQGEYDDLNAIQSFCQAVDIVSYENENIPLATAQYIEQHYSLAPSSAILAISQDRLTEKNCFKQLAIPTPQFYQVDSLEELQRAITKIGCPAVLKTRRMGYDGKGQSIIRNNNDITSAWHALGKHSLIVEAFVNYQTEVSLLAVRNNSETRYYPLTENIHQQGILKLSKAPYDSKHLYSQAIKYSQRILEHTDYIGVLAIEFFVVNNQLLANEIAPRVHNSGHWTIEGAVCSQFENHLRAICHWPLGSTEAINKTVMYNCLGQMPDRTAVLSLTGTHYHDYQKKAVAKRKLGHVTLTKNNDTADATLQTIIDNI